MTIETLMTLAVAGVILVALGVLRLAVALGVKATRAGIGTIAVLVIATVVTWLRAAATGIAAAGRAGSRGARS